MTQCACNREPTLSDMLEDPIVQLVMTRDGVARIDVEELVHGLAIPRTRVGSQKADCACARSEELVNISSSVDRQRR